MADDDPVALRDIKLTPNMRVILGSDRPDPPISRDRLKRVCKIGMGARCCRYIVGGLIGICCAKHNPRLRAEIDDRVEAGLFVAKGDNCKGLRVQ